MSTIEILLAVIAIIDFVGAILAGLLGQDTASLVMIGLLPLLWVTWVTREVVLLRKGVIALREEASVQREEPKPVSRPTNERHLLEDPLWISSVRKNQQKINSDFLGWDQCTLMIWVLVPKRGNSLRNAPDNRYLLAHQTEGISDFNRFALLYSSSNRWEVQFSNNKAESNQLRIDDGLDQGWHHFLIAWDRTRPDLVFLIDGRVGGSDRSKSYLPCWPERLGDFITVGAWVSAYDTSYCETNLFGLWILDRFLEPTDPIVKEHLDLIKQIS